MNQLLKIEWWKWTAILLMLYVLVAGFLIPLKPGIIDVFNSDARVAEPFTTEVRTYNTRLGQADDIRAWLWLPGDSLIMSKSVSVINDTYLKAEFDTLGNGIDVQSRNGLMASLMIDNSLEGHYFFRNAINIKSAEMAYMRPQVFYGLDEIKTRKQLAFPFQHILYETSRNTYFHVAIWMAMFALLILSCYYSIRYLISKKFEFDIKASSVTTAAIVFGIAGLLTGSMWAKYTWGAFWTNDIKLNMTAIALLVYLAYWILRSSVSDPDTRARLSSVFNLFAFAMLMVLVMVIPRLTDSLHPGNGGNPAFSSYDMDNTMRMVFYPAIVAYFLIGLWMAQLRSRLELISRD